MANLVLKHKKSLVLSSGGTMLPSQLAYGSPPAKRLRMPNRTAAPTATAHGRVFYDL